MNKRIAAAVLWLFAGWYLGAFVAYVVGVSSLLGPVIGIAAAAFFAGDPLGVIWKASTGRSATSSSAVGSAHAVLDR